MPEAWRIVPAARASNAFNGEGARLYGGRWNRPGHRAVYLGGSRALAALELLVHINPTHQRLLYLRFTVRIPSGLVERLDETALPDDFGHGGPIDPRTQAIGDDWLRGATKPVLRVPSAIIPEEPNYLLNPSHPDFPQIAITEPERFAFDPRLIDVEK